MRSVIVGALAVGACGLVSKDIVDVKLRLPEKSFTLDADAWNLPPGTAPSVPCTAGCATGQAVLCGSATCSADCDAATGTCQAHVTLSVSQSYDLTKESADYQAIGSQSLVTFGVDSIAVQVSSNSLDFATPELSLALAPATDGSPELVGTLAPIPAGATGSFNVAFAPGGADVIKKYMFDTYKTPFRAVITGTATVKAGDPTPRGKLVGAVVVMAHAGP
jgi:hypothetical protein